MEGAIAPRYRVVYLMKRMHHTDLVDDGEDGVEEHQVMLLQRQVVGLLQSEQHRPDQGDLGWAKRTCNEKCSYHTLNTVLEFYLME